MATYRFNPFTGTLDEIGSGGGGGGGTVTSVGGGVGLTATPEPIVGAGTIDLDIFSLTTETALAAGDWFPFVDVSVGTTPAAQRKVTFANLTAGLNPVLDHGLLLGLADDDHAQYLRLAGRAGTANNALLSTSVDGQITGSSAAANLILSASSVALAAGLRVQTTHSLLVATLAGTAGGHPLNSQHIYVDAAPQAQTLLENGAVNALNFSPTLTFMPGGLGHQAARVFRHFAIYSMPPGETQDAGTIQLGQSRPTFSCADAAASYGDLDSRGISHVPIFEDTGTGNLATEDYAVVHNSEINSTWTVADVALGSMRNPSGTGTITRLGGLHLNDLTRGVANYSLWSEGAAPFLAHGGPGVFGAAQTTLTAPTNASVGLEVGGTTRALLLSRLTTAQKTTLTGVAVADGMLLYDTTLAKLQVREGGAWVGYALTTAVVTDHGALTGLGDDDHTIYALLAGRSGGQTLIGGTASGDDLFLQSTSNATRGTIDVIDQLRVATTTPTLTGTYNAIDALPNAHTIGAVVFRALTYQGAATVSDTITAIQLFRFGATFSTASSVTRNLGPQTALVVNPTYTPGSSATMNGLSLRGVFVNPTFTNAGTANVATLLYGLELSSAAVNTNWTVTDMGAVNMLDPTGSGTITRLFGMHLAALTRGTTNASLWSEGTGAFLAHAGDAFIGGSQSTLTAPSATLHAQESTAISDGTIGGEVFRVETVATNDDPNYRVFQGRVTTTDATVTTLLSFATATSFGYLIEARVVARRTGGSAGTAGDIAAYVLYAGVKNVGGTATVIGNLGAPYDVTSTASVVTGVITPGRWVSESVAGYEVTLDTSVGNVRVRVTGVANTNITWHCTLIVQGVGS